MIEQTQLRIVQPIKEPAPPVRQKNPVVTGPAAGVIRMARALTQGRAAIVAAFDAMPETSSCGRSRGHRFEAQTDTRPEDVERFRRWLARLPHWRRRLYMGSGPLRWRQLPADIRREAVKRARALRAASRAVLRKNGGRPFRYRRDYLAAMAAEIGVTVAKMRE